MHLCSKGIRRSCPSSTSISPRPRNSRRLSSPPTSPEPTYDTPNHSRSEATTPAASLDALFDSRAEPRLTEPQPRRSQQDINVVPQHENTEHAGGESDADNDDEEDDSEDAELARGIWRKEDQKLLLSSSKVE